MGETTLSVHPAWDTLARSVPVGPSQQLREALAAALDLEGSWLVAADETGHPVDLDTLAPANLGAGAATPLPALVVSAAPLVRALPLTADRAHRQSRETRTARPDDTAEPIVSEACTEEERQLARGLVGLGLDPGAMPARWAQLVDDLPELPPGYGVDTLSPYRVLFATAHVLEGERDDDLDEIEATTQQAVGELGRRLRLAGSSDLDSRLYLLVPHDPLGTRALASYAAGGPRPEGAGRRHRGWRRVVVVPYDAEAGRLRSTARLAQQLAVERAEPELLRRTQTACGRFAPAYSAERWLDHQSQVLLRPAAERLRMHGEARLARRVAERFTVPPSRLETASVAALTRRLWARAGLFDAIYSHDGPRWDETPAPWPVPERDAGEGLDVRAAATELSSQTAPAVLPSSQVDRLARTAAVAAACRLRSALEEVLEREVFPAAGAPTLDLSDFLASLARLDRELSCLVEPEACDRDTEPPLLLWLAGRTQHWRNEEARHRRRALRAAEPFHLWWMRWLAALGLPLHRDRRRFGERWASHRAAAAQSQVAARLEESARDGSLGAAFDGIVEMIRSCLDLGISARSLGEMVAEESAIHDTFLALEADGSERPLARTVQERLDRAVDELDPADALGECLAVETGLGRWLDRGPEALLEEIWTLLSRALDRRVTRIVAHSGLPPLESSLPPALAALFGGPAVAHTGAQGRLGALDGRTHVMAWTGHRLLERLGGEEAAGDLVRAALPALGIDAPVEVVACRSVPGMLLIRCVHALSPAEVLT